MPRHVGHIAAVAAETEFAAAAVVDVDFADTADRKSVV